LSQETPEAEVLNMLLRTKGIAILGSLGLLVIVLELVRRRRLKEEYSIFWLVTAIGLLVLSSWENLLNILAELMGIFYPPSALFVIGFGFALLTFLHFSVIVSELSTENKELAQQVGLLNWKLSQLQGKEAGDDIQEGGKLQHDDPNIDLRGG
jgi:hypothetical protein